MASDWWLAVMLLSMVFPWAPGTRAQNSGDLRLVDSVSINAQGGRVEIYLKGEWGTVCTPSHRYGAQADTACKQLGYLYATTYGSVGQFHQLNFTQASPSTKIWLDNLDCSPSDDTLLSCDHSGIGVHSCSHSTDFAVVCTNGTFPYANLNEGDLRLVDSLSTDTRAGRLEIFMKGVWGTVCDIRFGLTEANVACRQLGFSSATRYGNVVDLNFLPANTYAKIWLGEVTCSPSNTTLLSCVHSTYRDSHCTHDTDIAVVCTGGTLPASPNVGDLRLVNSSSTNAQAGRLEIYLLGQWGTVCYDLDFFEFAYIACMQLGYSFSPQHSSAVQLGYSSANASTPVWLNGLRCGAYNTTLLSCNHGGTIGENRDCSHYEDAAIVCAYEYSEGDLRLVGPYRHELTGRLEIYLQGKWGTVCDDGFGFMEGDVACRQLRRLSASSVGNVNELGYMPASTSTEMWLYDVDCNRGQTSLLSCSHGAIGSGNCSRLQAVALKCSRYPRTDEVGVAVGIGVPLLVLFLVVGVACVCVYMRQRKKRTRFLPSLHLHMSAGEIDTEPQSTPTTSYTPTQVQQATPPHPSNDQDKPLPQEVALPPQTVYPPSQNPRCPPSTDLDPLEEGCSDSPTAPLLEN